MAPKKKTPAAKAPARKTPVKKSSNDGLNLNQSQFDALSQAKKQEYMRSYNDQNRAKIAAQGKELRRERAAAQTKAARAEKQETTRAANRAAALSYMSKNLKDKPKQAKKINKKINKTAAQLAKGRAGTVFKGGGLMGARLGGGGLINQQIR